MNAVVRRTLCDLIDKYGADLCDAPRRCEGLLRDFCGRYRGEIKVLVDALEEGITTDLRSSHSVPQEVVQGRLVKRLQENLLLTEEVAKWAVESWAIALNKLEVSPSPPPQPPEPVIPNVETSPINPPEPPIIVVPAPAPVHPPAPAPDLSQPYRSVHTFQPAPVHPPAPAPDPVKPVRSGTSVLTYVLGVTLIGTALVMGALLSQARQQAEVQVDSLEQQVDSLEKKIDRLETAVTESIGADSREFKLHNECSQSIKFALRYRDNSKFWETGWWTFSANRSAYLADADNKSIQVTSPIIYYYAEIPDKNYTWSGEEKFFIEGEMVNMRIWVVKPASGAYRMSLTCDNVQ